jgi:hypothetical protein
MSGIARCLISHDRVILISAVGLKITTPNRMHALYDVRHGEVRVLWSKVPVDMFKFSNVEKLRM